ncbi:hypothetical protein L916_10863 [Phytophthora nicotianae]|uniref:Fibronectin type-III domain-containing protein n=1 Tax=Phytophthora nicotianae TaxID=4792 RepID=W2ITE5_PHYNI|nr:hypothetical protein L916_10863 [Phytophthora nicotianae]
MSEATSLFGRAATDASASSRSNGSGGRSAPTVSLPDAESRRNLLHRTPGGSQRSQNGDNVSFLSSTPIEEFVAKYQVIKVSWRGKYERILALAPTRFCTIDPRDFEVTNTWSLTALVGINLDPSDAQGFALSLKGAKKDEQLKLRCRFRSRLLSDLYRLRDQYQQRNGRSETGFQCSKWSRKCDTINCMLDVGMDGVTLTQPGIVRSKYLYTEMEHLTLLTDSQDGFAIGYTGRSRLFFSQHRAQIYRRIQAAAEAIGCKLQARTNVTAEKIQEERNYYGLNNGEPFVQFHVRKLTPKYHEPQERVLSLHDKMLVELDRDEKVIACYNYADIYVLVREPSSPEQFKIQFRNGQMRTYLARDRDGVLSAIYDICVTCDENPELFITGFVNQRGLRLLPFSAVEDTTETQSFFNDSSIASWYLQRMGSVAKFGNSMKVGDRGFVEIVAEFNANVPASGIPYNTKHSIIGDALRPMCAQLYYVAKTKPVPERSAVTLLQAMFRISSSYYGFREIGQAGQISETITNLLINGDEFVVFWTTLLLRRLTAHTPSSSASLDKASVRYCEEIETENKKVFLANTYLTQSLITHLEDIDVDPESHHSSHNPRAGPLVMMGLLQTLEGCLCSRASTTGTVEFMTLVEGVAKYYSTLLKVLFQSRCATTVEACTLLLKTTLEECDPVVASSIRDKALTEGIVLRHFYQGLFDESFDQRCVSRYLVSLWMSHHDGSKQLLSRMIPSGFFHLLKEPPGTAAQIEDYDRLEREAMEAERQERLLEYNDDDRASSTSESTIQGGSMDWLSGGESSIADSEIHQEKMSRKSVSMGDVGSGNGRQSGLQSEYRRSSLSNLPIPEIRSSFSGERSSLTRNASNGRSSYETPIENEQSKARLLRKLKSSVDGTSKSLRSTNNSMHESKSRSSSSHDPAPRLRKRDVALSFLGALGGKKAPAQHGNKTSKGRHRAISRSARAQENFRLLFHMLSLDHETVHMIWNKQTREELRSALYAEIKRFTQFQINSGMMKARWNYEDFEVPYPSLANEVGVGGCYIRILAHLRSKMSFFGSVTEEDEFIVLTPEQVPVRNPAAVLAALYVRMLRENIHAEYRDDLETSILCIKSMGVVAAAHAGYVNAVNFEEVEHLWTLMSETVHASMLANFLQTVRALCMHPGNARRVLRSEHNVELAVQLLQLAHSTNRDVGDITEPKKLWILETDGGEQLGPFSVNELKQKRDEEHTDMSSFWVKRHDDLACESFTTKAKVMEIAQLRWEVGILGDLNPLQMAHDAISVLLSVAHSNSLLSKRDDDFTSPIFPLPRGKTTLWRFARQILPVLIRSNHPKLWEKVATLLEFLYIDQQPIGESPEEDVTNRASLFSWGLFYLAFVGGASDFKSMAGLLKATHKHQAKFNGTSSLKNILPQAMINLLDQSSPSAFTNVFCEGEQSPLVIWNDAMREHLQTVCQAHLQDYAEVLEEDASRDWCFCPMAPVAFKELADEVWCGGVYLGQFCEHGTFDIADPLNFMEKLTMEWRAEVNRQDTSMTFGQARQILDVTDEEGMQNSDATLRAGFKEKGRALIQSNISASTYSERLDELQEAYRVLTCPRPTLLSAGHDPENLLLLLHSLVIMCNRYPEQLVDYEFDAYDLLLPLLDSHCTADGVPPEGTTTAQTLDISVCAAELIYNTCAVSVANGELLLEQPDLNTLEKVVNFCVDSMVGCEAAEKPELLEVCFYLLQTITGLLASPRGREWIAESSTLLVDMVRILWMWNNAEQKSFVMAKLAQQVLEGISRMAQLEKNQQRLVKAGVLWQLFKLFSTYDVELDDTTVRTRLQHNVETEEEGYATVAVEIQNLLAVMAVRALCRLGGLFIDGSELQSPPNALVKQVVDALMTPNLSGLLLLSSHHEFLKIFHGECESYTLFWNSEMRQELMNFVSPRASVEPAMTTNEQYVDAIKFRFMYLADLFYVGGLYIEMLMGSLLVIEKSMVPAPIAELGLTETFFKELFSFIDSGELVYPEFVNEEGSVQRLPPYAGWNIDEEQRITLDRVTALNCLSIATSVAPTLVEKNLVANDSAMKMVLRLLFPPDNEVHQSEDAEKSLVLTQQLYVPCRLHCIATLQVLSTLEDFSTAALEFGICDILIELVHICQDVGPDALGIIRNLCANGAAAKCVSEILQSGVYLEFIGWLLLVEETIVDDEFDAAERLRIPSAMILSELVKDGAPLNIESRRALCRFFPPAIIRTIASCPDTIVEYIMADHKTPELVWNAEFRNHQRNSIVNFLNIYFSSTSITETEDGNFTSVVDSFEIDYTGLYPAPMAGNVYLTLYMEDPTFNLHDPLYFMTCLWSEFEVLFKQLAHMTSALRATMPRADDEMIQRDINLIDLVGSSLVCLLQFETPLLENAAELQIPSKCCEYLNQTVRSQACEPCVVNVVRILRVCTMSRTCITSMQSMCSTALSCLMAIINPIRGGPLHCESAFVLEIMRRIVKDYPEHGDRDASAGIVYLASRLDLFGFLLNILENPDSLGKVKEQHIVRAEAIEILNMLEKDRVQGSTAHQILKKHKKWQKSYRHEATDVVKAMATEDPFLKLLFPEADRVMRALVKMASRAVRLVTCWLMLLINMMVRTDAQSSNPSIIAWGSATGGTLHIQWNLSTALDPDELEGYHVIVNNQERATVGPDASSYYLYGLSNNTVYSYQVKAILANGSEPLYSDVVAATTLNRTAPNSPDIPTKVTVSGGFVQVSVETPHDTGGVALSNVTVVVSDIYGVVTSQTLSVTSSGVLVFNSYGLNARTKYWISAFATNEGDLVSSNSDPLVITTTALQLPGPCPPPTVVKATGASVLLQLNPPLDDGGSRIQGYNVYIAADDISDFTEVTTTIDTDKIDAVEILYSSDSDDEPLLPNTRYFFKAVAVNLADICISVPISLQLTNGTEAWTTAASVPGAPPSPYFLKATGGMITMLLLKPTNMQGVNCTGFSIKIGDAAGNYFENSVDADDDVMFNATSLQSNSSYAVFVAVITDLGTSLYSAPTIMNTTVPTAPSNPRDIAVTNVTESSALLEWSSPFDSGDAEITGYTIILMSPGRQEEISAISSPILIENLAANKMYTVKVTAANAAGKKSASTIGGSFSTLSLTPPGKPLDIALIFATGGAIEIAWNPSQNRGGELLSAIEYKTTAFRATPCFNSSISSPCSACNSVKLKDTQYQLIEDALLCQQPTTQCPDSTFNCCLTRHGSSHGFGLSCGLMTPVTGPRAVVGTTSAIFNGLNYSSTYYFSVQASNRAGKSTISELQGFQTTVQTSPSYPASLRQLGATGGSIQFTWDSPVDTGGGPVVGYRVYRNYELLTPRYVMPPYSDCSGMAAETTYVYGVAAVNASLVEGAMAVIKLSTEALSTPMAPTFSLIGSMYNRLQVSVTPPCDTGGEPSLSYQYMVKNAGTVVDSTSFNCCSFVLENLEPNQSYSVLVKVENSLAAPSTWAQAMFKTASGIPPTPVATLLQVNTYSAVIAIGSKPYDKDTRSYDVFLRRNGIEIQNYTVSCEEDAIFDHYVCPTSYKLEMLKATTEYEISAQANGPLGSSASNPVSFKTSDISPGAFGMADTNYNADKDGIINTVVRRSNGTSGAVEVGVHVTGPDTVFLRCKRATSGGCDCTLYLISSESVPLPCYLSFVDGQENASVAFSMWDDQSAELLPSQVVVSPFGVDLSGQHSAVLHMDARQEAGFVSFPASSSVIYEDSSFVMINVLRLNGTTGRVTFSFESFDIAAVTGEDYVAVSGTIVLTDQQSSTQIWVQLIDNLVVNSDKVFGLRLTGQTELTGADQLLTHNVTIHDDESISSAVPRKTDNISIVYSTGGEFEIGWTSTASDGVNVTGYLVRVSNASLGTFYSVFNTTQTIFTLSGLSARSIYLVEVAVWNHFGVGEYSDAVEVATTDATLPSSPLSLSATDIFNTEVTLTWKPLEMTAEVQ